MTITAVSTNPDDEKPILLTSGDRTIVRWILEEQKKKANIAIQRTERPAVRRERTYDDNADIVAQKVLLEVINKLIEKFQE